MERSFSSGYGKKKLSKRNHQLDSGRKTEEHGKLGNIKGQK